MLTVFLVGTAGSGKSRLTATFSDWLKMTKQDVAVVNLDPGVSRLPYSPDVDVRDYVNVDKLMDKYDLGPNGALILASDLVADEIGEISRAVEELQSDIVLVDTSGQIELFAFRASGPYVASEITKEQKVIVYLFDAVFSLNPQNYISNLFLSVAVYTRFLTPQIHILSKSDLLPKEQLSRIVDWSLNKNSLAEAIDQNLAGTKRLLNREMMQAIYRVGLSFPLIPVSAETSDGIISLNMALERILSQGEKYTF